MRTKLMILAIAAAVFAVSAALAGGANPVPAKVSPFKITMDITAKGVAVSSTDDGGWSVSYGTDPGGARAFYFSPGHVSPDLADVPTTPYCIGVEYGADGVKLTSVNGTNWRALSYNCGSAPLCRVTVTENGVYGE